MARRRARKTRSAEIRERLGHPLIDGDGHIMEAQPVLLDYLRQVSGARTARRFETLMTTGGGPWGWYAQSEKQRADRRSMRPPFWIMPAANTLDRATAMLPALMRERMDDFGIDFAIVYTSMGLPFVSYHDDDLRRGVCRALNVMYADIFAGQEDRLTPAAVIPMHTPAEAIEEAEYAVCDLGHRAVMIAGTVTRPVPYAARKAPALARHATWVDVLALDSPYDYDPVWAKFAELGVAPAAHSNSMGWGARATTSNYTYNHIGHFAAAGEAFAKALFFGGVTKRFPQLNFAFLEGGAAWASQLLGDIVEHWKKRNIRAMRKNLDPARVDTKLLDRMIDTYGGDLGVTLRKGSKARDATYGGGGTVDADTADEFAACGIRAVDDIRERFVPNFYYGCEADDRFAALSFDTKLNPFGARLNAMFSSDIGHWDVPDMTGVVGEAYELLEEGHLSRRDFRDFTFANVVRLHRKTNPHFFKGTVVEAAAARVK